MRGNLQPLLDTLCRGGLLNEDFFQVAFTVCIDVGEKMLVAQQVEVANEAMDQGYRYGLERDARL